MITEQDAKTMILARLERGQQKEGQSIFLSCEALTPREAKQRYGGKFIGVHADAILEAVEVQYAMRIRIDENPLIWRDWEIRKDLVITFASRPFLLE